MLWKKLTSKYKNDFAAFDTKELLDTSIPLFGVVMLNMIISWSPMLFLGVWESNDKIGIYSAASRTAMLISFILIAVNTIAAPKFAALYQQRDFESLASVAKNATKIMVVLSVPPLLLLMLFPGNVLSLFGEQFKEGATILVILAFGQFVNVATGSVGYLLVMTGSERAMRNNQIFCAFIMVILSLFLIPTYGGLGAAIATTMILMLQNLVAAMIVKNKLNIVTLPFISVIHSNSKNRQ
jgi:O-antigen/teichoic acid export membrane protein